MFDVDIYDVVRRQSSSQACDYLLKSLDEVFNEYSVTPDSLIKMEESIDNWDPSDAQEIGKLIDAEGRTYLHKSVIAKSRLLTQLFLQHTNPFIVDNKGCMAIHYSKTVEFWNLFIDEQCLITHKSIVFNVQLNILPRALFIGNITCPKQYQHNSIICDEKTLSEALPIAQPTEIELFTRRFTEFTQQHHNSGIIKLNILSQFIEKCLMPLINREPFNLGELIIPRCLNLVNYADYNDELMTRLDLFKQAKIVFTTYSDERENSLRVPIQDRVKDALALCVGVLGCVFGLGMAGIALWFLLTIVITVVASFISPSFRFSEMTRKIWEGIFWILALCVDSAVFFSGCLLAASGIILGVMYANNRLMPSVLAEFKAIEDAYMHELLKLLGTDPQFDKIHTLIRNNALSFHKRIIGINEVVKEEEATLTKKIEHTDKKVRQSINLPFFKTSRNAESSMKSSRKVIAMDKVIARDSVGSYDM